MAQDLPLKNFDFRPYNSEIRWAVSAKSCSSYKSHWATKSVCKSSVTIEVTPYTGMPHTFRIAPSADGKGAFECISKDGCLIGRQNAVGPDDPNGFMDTIRYFVNLIDSYIKG